MMWHSLERGIEARIADHPEDDQPFLGEWRDPFPLGHEPLGYEVLIPGHRKVHDLRIHMVPDKFVGDLSRDEHLVGRLEKSHCLQREELLVPWP